MTAQRESAPDGDAHLSDRDLAVLEFERTWWQHVGAKEQAIRAEFGLSAARYYQVLNAVIDSPDALRHDPLLVRRLQRARDSRTRARMNRTFTIPVRGEDQPPTEESNH